MLKRILACASLLALTAANAEKYSVYTHTAPLVQGPADAQATLNLALDAADEEGFNTISLYVAPDMLEVTGDYMGTSGYLSNPAYRQTYVNIYRAILTHARAGVPSNFNLMIRIHTGSEHMTNVHDTRTLPWENNDLYLRHEDVAEMSTVIDPATGLPARHPITNVPVQLVEDPTNGFEQWVRGIDFYDQPAAGTWRRRRMLNFNNPLVWSVVKDVYSQIIRDVVDVAESLGAENRIIVFTWNTTTMTESEYWFAGHVGNDAAGNFNPLFNAALRNPDGSGNRNRRDWFDRWQGDLGDWHGKLSDLVVDERNRAGTAFHFTFGAQWSAAHDESSLRRGTFNFASLASKLNPGDWINNADVADWVAPQMNHNVTTDFYHSIGQAYGLRISNEISWPGFLFDHGLTAAQGNDAFRRQAERSYNHGAEAFHVTNWLPGDISLTVYDGLMNYVTTTYTMGNHTVPAERTEAIYLDPWSLYAMGSSATTPPWNTKSVFDATRVDYDLLSPTGDRPIQYLTPQLLVDRPQILDRIRNIRIPADNIAVTREAARILSHPRHAHKARLQHHNVGNTDEFLNTSPSLAALKAADLLWVDKSSGSPGLRVRSSTQSGFIDVSLWAGWGGLASAKGQLKGDFNGDGRDDMLNVNSSSGLEVVISNGITNFSALQNWGNWAADFADLRVGDFNGDGRDDLLWVDKTNKFTGDVSPDLPGLLVSLSTGTSFAAPTLWYGWGGLTDSFGFYVGDFDGDSRDDFLNFASNYQFQVVLSNPSGGGFHNLGIWASWGADGPDLRIGDFDGNGRADVLWVDKNNKYGGPAPGLQVILSDGTGFGFAQRWADWTGLASSQGHYVGDFNGDGRCDFLNFASDSRLHVALSNFASNGFDPSADWGAWGVGAADLRVGNFGVGLYAMQSPGNPIVRSVLYRDIPVTFFSGGELRFTFTVPSGARNASITMSGGTGNANLYVRHAAEPNATTFNCRPNLAGNNESCSLTQGAGTYYVWIDDASAYAVSSLVGTYTTDPLPPPAPTGAGTIQHQTWWGIPGSQVFNLTSNAAYPNSPNSSQLVTSFDIGFNRGDDYGTRVLGYLHPNRTDSYRFWINGDDQSELRLSTNESPGSSVLIARVPSWSGNQLQHIYTFPEQESFSIPLVAGQRYYIEALHKEGPAGDHMAVWWDGVNPSQPQIISGAYLSPFQPTVLSHQGVGSPTLHGTSGLSGTTYTVKGAGADIWGTTDQFHFAHQDLNGSGEIVARLASLQNTHASAKAGVMIRENLAGNAKNAVTLATPGAGYAFQRRTATGGTTTTSTATGTAPVWLKLIRTGDKFTSMTSSNGASWTSRGTQTFSMAAGALAGLAVTSHNTGSLSTAIFEKAYAFSWTSQDIGSIGVAGSNTQDGPTYTVNASGADIWGTTDAFRFIHQKFSGNGTIIARLSAIENTHAQAKAGIMWRDGLAANAKHAYVAVTPTSAMGFFSRTSAGGTTARTTHGTGSMAPQWMRLIRSGNTFQAATSEDGATWTNITPVTITMGTDCYVGIAVTSHDNAQLNTSTFDNVTLTP